MAGINLQQTDTAAADGNAAFCGRAVGAGVQKNSTATSGGTAGSVSQAVTVNASIGDKNYIVWETKAGELDGYVINAGPWVVPVNLTTGFASTGTASYASIFICRVNSAGVSQATIGSLTGLTTLLDSTGISTFTVNGIAQTQALGDKITIQVNLSNSDISNHNGAFTFNQLITTPLTLPLSLSGPVDFTYGLIPANPISSNVIKSGIARMWR